MSNHKIFNGDTAWFSSSVSQKAKNLWKRNGGQMSPLDSAMFVFSQDFSSPDTLQIFCSEAYLDEHLAVIHPMFISDSVTRESKAILLQYKLPPEEVYQATKDKQVYKWDKNADLEKNKQQPVSTGRQTRKKAKLCRDENMGSELEGAKTRRRQGPSYTDSEYDSSVSRATERQQSIATLRKVPGSERQSSADMSRKVTGSEKQSSADMSRKVTGSERQLPASTSNNVPEDMCHIDDIPKITGVLEEFIPGQNGCEVFKK